MRSCKRCLTAVLALSLVSLPAISAEGLLDKTVTINSKDAEISTMLQTLGQQAGVPITVGHEVSGRLTYGAEDITLRQALDEITAENGLVYSIMEDHSIVVRKAAASATTGAQSAAAAPATSLGPGEVHQIPLKYASCTELISKMTLLIPRGEKIIADDVSNSLIYVGSAEDFARIKEMVTLFDTQPRQIMIQGLIIETSETYLQNIGFTWGDQTKTAASNGTASSSYIATVQPSPANFGLLVGAIDGRKLAMSLSAAESNGDAKVISRPKVVTINNKPALINSGLTINVKTLSSVQSAQPGQTATAVAGGLSSLNAGLTVSILPTIVGDREVKLALHINSSSPDQSVAVDGIPGVQSDSANTTVIVKDGKTAIIAGLIKQSKSDSHDGVPILKDIPVLGYLFQSHVDSDQNNELAIFITPTVLSEEDDGKETALYPVVPNPDEEIKRVGTKPPPRW